MNAVDVIKKLAQEEVSKLGLIDIGEVTSTFPHAGASDTFNNECNVKLKNGDIELRHVPVLTGHTGLAHMPNVGDLALVAFIGGKIDQPVIIGYLFNDQDRPPVNEVGELVYEAPFSQKSGMRRLYMKFPNSVELTITDDDIKVGAGSTVVTIKTNGDVKIESTAGVEIKATGSLALSGASVKVESQGLVEVKGSMIKIG